MPMAQALVMVRHKAEAALDPVLSPMRSPPGPQYDSSLITSSVRKRKRKSRPIPWPVAGVLHLCSLRLWRQPAQGSLCGASGGG